MRIIDAKDLIAGRIATVAAKKSLLGEEIMVVNCEKAVITGKKEAIVEKFKRFQRMGTPSKGPFYPRNPDRIMKRIIRGMIPYKQHKGRDALKKIKCFNGIPKELEGQKMETISEANISKLPNLKYQRLETMSRIMGGKSA